MGGPANKNRAASEQAGLPKADAPISRAFGHVQRQAAGYDGTSDGRPRTPEAGSRSLQGSPNSRSSARTPPRVDTTGRRSSESRPSTGTERPGSPTSQSRGTSRASPPGSPAKPKSPSPNAGKSAASEAGSSVAATVGSSNVAERDIDKSRMLVDMKNLDLGVLAFNVSRKYEGKSKMPERTKLSTLGTAAKIGLNSFAVTEFPSKPVYQYEVHIGSGQEKRGLVKKMWNSKPVQAVLGSGFIFDGNRLAWSLKSFDREAKLDVDLDKEDGKTPRANAKKNVHRFLIRKTNQVKFDALRAFLEKKCDWDARILESINFLDHALRESPSQKYTQIKRNFFARGSPTERVELGMGVEALKGCYQSLRVVKTPTGGAGLAVNLDVANGTFFMSGELHFLAYKISGSNNVNDLIVRLQREKQQHKTSAPQGAHTQMKKLRHLHVQCRHRGKQGLDEYCIERVTNKGSKDTFFDKRLEDGKTVSMSVHQYFSQTYNIRLQHPELPLVQMTKKSVLMPMELLKVKENQRYPFKCDDNQTKEMIKFAVTPPQGRWNAVEHGLRMLDWANDPILRHFGLKISNKKLVVEGRVLPAPKVQFGVGTANPGTSGRWDLKGKKFLTTGKVINCWSVCVWGGRRGGKPTTDQTKPFVDAFIKAYEAHGGKVTNKAPPIHILQGSDIGLWVTTAWNLAGNQMQTRPDLLVFILPDREAMVYGRIKRSADCRYGVASQVMQWSHTTKAAPQYISNVLMKVNAKLGGTTCKAVGSKSNAEWGQFGKSPTFVVGADVSHAAPGQVMNSAAAITFSQDKLGIKYAAMVESNAYRVEMIKTETWYKHLRPMLLKWASNCGGGRYPQRIIYMRDGVSEGQYQHVLDQEVADMKGAISEYDPSINIPFIVIVGSKRHHVRFFPERGDKNANPFPGTLVQTGVTHPYENDWYMCSHSAIKGTARPVHYHMLLNETKTPDDEIFTMLYEQSYQYARATTPVSIHPAIYYAHLASNRAVPHDPYWGGSDPNAPGAKKPGPPQQRGDGQEPPILPPGSIRPATKEELGAVEGDGSAPKTSGSKSKETKNPIDHPYMPILAQGGLNFEMWYI